VEDGGEEDYDKVELAPLVLILLLLEEECVEDGEDDSALNEDEGGIGGVDEAVPRLELHGHDLEPVHIYQLALLILFSLGIPLELGLIEVLHLVVLARDGDGQLDDPEDGEEEETADEEVEEVELPLEEVVAAVKFARNGLGETRAPLLVLVLIVELVGLLVLLAVHDVDEGDELEDLQQDGKAQHVVLDVHAREQYQVQDLIIIDVVEVIMAEADEAGIDELVADTDDEVNAQQDEDVLGEERVGLGVYRVLNLPQLRVDHQYQLAEAAN